MKFKIDTEFPDDTLITIMKPYILLYITSLYSLVAIIKSNAFAKLKYKLMQLYKFNPIFGRKMVVIDYSIIKSSPPIVPGINNIKIAIKPKPHIKKYVFNDKHIDYFKTENDTFFENHKTLKGLYNVDYLRITNGQRLTNTNIYIIADDSDDETTDTAADTDTDDNVDDDDNNADDDDNDDNMDTEDDAADNIQYEYTYEYNYNTPNS
jgi:hypothetical protein